MHVSSTPPRPTLHLRAAAWLFFRAEQTPVDAALSRGHQQLVDLINTFSAPSKDVDEADDVPDDAEEAGEADMELEGSGAVQPQQQQPQQQPAPDAA